MQTELSSRARHILEKEKTLTQFLSFHRSKPVEQEFFSVKLFIHQLPKELDLLMFNNFLLNEEAYAEDYGSFLLLMDMLKEYAVSDIEEADLVVFPFNLYAQMPGSEEILAGSIARLREMAGGKRVILFSIGDFCLRPGRRSTSFEQKLFASVKDAGSLLPAWLQPSDILICFESTPDLLQNNICVFPLIAVDTADPLQSKKDLLFSFAGQYYKRGWPEGFVRSPSNRRIWEGLAKRYASQALITEQESTAGKDRAAFYDIPRRSVFTLCPRGIACWSFRTFEALLSGSIPVILSDSYSRPFPADIDWDSFSIVVPERRLSEVGMILASLEPGHIRQMQENLRRSQHHFSFAGLRKIINHRLTGLKNKI